LGTNYEKRDEMSEQIVENGKVYTVEDGKVTEASVLKTAYYGDCPNPECKEYGKMKYDLDHSANCEDCGTSLRVVYPTKEEDAKSKKSTFEVGDRVEVDGRLGEVLGLGEDFYGIFASVRHDDGEIEGYILDRLSGSEEPAVNHASPIENLVAEFEKYDEMPAYTEREIEAKTRLAHGLNARAKALTTDKSIALSDLVQLDRIVTITAVDVIDMKDTQALLQSAESLAKDSSYKISTNEGGRELLGYSGGGDASWLATIDLDNAVADPDEHLAKVASVFVDRFSPEQLRDDEFVLRAIEMQSSYEPMLNDGGHRETFRKLLDTARMDRLAKVAKTANVEEPEPVNLDTLDVSSLFLGE
jgi:hypothetical protein